MKDEAKHTTQYDWEPDPNYNGENLADIIEQIEDCLTEDEMKELVLYLCDKVGMSVMQVD